jgi:hypothetical protein
VSETQHKLDDDIDALFKLPVADFTGARNTLAARLKKEGRQNEAERVKLLVKPSISVWTVNQLYWKHREAFDQLIATGKRFRPGKVAHMRDSLDARREVLSHLSDLATALLRDAGHNPALDTMRRITTTLEALAAYALLSDGPTPGRLTHDVDPPSFESLASLMSSAKEQTKESTLITPAGKSGSVGQNTRPKAATSTDLRQIRQAKIAAAKVSLQDAKRSLTDARAEAQSLEAALEKANAEMKEAEKYRREAEQRLEQATALSEDAAKTLTDARRTVDKATKELESLLRESP